MARHTGELQFYHINLSVGLSESDSSWYDPKVTQDLSFSIPAELFTSAALARMIEKMVGALGPQFAAEKAKYLMEAAAKEAAEKAKQEAEINA